MIGHIKRLSRSARPNGVQRNRRPAMPVESLEPRQLLTTFTVNTVSDSISPGQGLLTLRAAIADANAHAGADTIDFDPKVFKPGSNHTITLAHGVLSITDTSGATSIQGPGESVLTIDAHGASRVIQIAEKSTATISGLTIKNGVAPTDSLGGALGGGINNAGKLTLNHVAVVNNQANSIDENSAAIIAVGAGVYSSGALTVTNCTFTGNVIHTPDASSLPSTSVIGEGGGIFCSGALSVSGSTFQSNSVMRTGAITNNGSANSAAGGAIYCTDGLVLSSSTISGNSVAATGNTYNVDVGGFASGGGIFSAGTTSIMQCAISGNSAIGGPTYRGNYGGSASGGGVYSGGKLTITGSAITDNQATGASSGPGPNDGGNGGDASGGGVCAATGATISNSNISDNTALAGGIGGFYGTYFTGSASGGGVDSQAGTLSVTGSTISGNSAITQATSDSGSERAQGGGLNGGNVTIADSSITGNHAVGGSVGYLDDFVDGISAYGGGVFATTLTLTSSSVTANSAAGGNGFIDPTSILQGTGGDASGGGVSVSSGTTISYSTIAGNIATAGNNAGQTGGDAGARAAGAGLYIGDGTLHLLYSTVSNNSATGGVGPAGNQIAEEGGNGGDAIGGIFASANATLRLIDSTVSLNSAAAGPGGNAYLGEGPFPGGASGTAVGGIYGSDLAELYDSTVSANSATSAPGGTGAPAGSRTAVTGGFSSRPNHAYLANTVVSGNVADSKPGDVAGALQFASSDNLIGIGGGLANGIDGNKTGITNPKLLALGNYGGPTQTMAPMPGSPVIDAGSNSLIVAGVVTDQRGLPRIFNNTVDIGADEYTTITLSGTVYNDLNGNGSRQSNEPGLVGWQVYVDVGDVGYEVSGDPVATTNSAGNYTLTFAVNTTSSIIIREVRQNNWQRTQPSGPYPLGYYAINPLTTTQAHNLNFGDTKITAPI